MPKGLETAGKALWRGLGKDQTLTAGQRVLLLEACRISDRLDRLDQGLANREVWFTLVSEFDSDIATVVVDKALQEARQQALALRQILATLGVDKLGQSGPVKEVSFLDDLERRRADRVAEAAAL